MEIMEPIVAASRLVEERFAQCRVAFLSNTVLSSRRTPTSDLDVVVVLDGPPGPYRETVRAHGRIVELFVHSKESLTLFYGFDAQTRTCTLARMCADGHVLRDAHDEAGDIQRQARAVIDAGPTPLSDEDRLKYRFALTDQLDDFRGSDDQVEIIFIAGQLLAMAGGLAPVSERRWTGAGKWLARHLDDAPGEFANRLVEALRSLVRTDDKRPMIDVTEVILENAGGPLTEGFITRRPVD
jgi:hypothetical protein